MILWCPNFKLHCMLLIQPPQCYYPNFHLSAFLPTSLEFHLNFSNATFKIQPKFSKISAPLICCMQEHCIFCHLSIFAYHFFISFLTWKKNGHCLRTFKTDTHSFFCSQCSVSLTPPTIFLFFFLLFRLVLRPNCKATRISEELAAPLTLKWQSA